MPRLVKRTQLKRSEYHIIGESKKNEAKPVETEEAGLRDKHLHNYDEQIYDDTDFYERLLQELAESGTQGAATIIIN